MKEIIENYSIEKWKGLLKNDFEDGIFKKYAQLDEIKNNFYENGALYASMTGSGSTMFGIFKEAPINAYNILLEL